MLSSAKPILEQALKQMLYEAYMNQFNPNKVTESSHHDSEAEQLYMKKARDFSEKACGPTATAIYNFVMEIGIQATNVSTVIAPPLPPALPGGPCSGVIPIPNFQIS